MKIGRYSLYSCNFQSYIHVHVEFCLDKCLQTFVQGKLKTARCKSELLKCISGAIYLKTWEQVITAQHLSNYSARIIINYWILTLKDQMFHGNNLAIFYFYYHYYYYYISLHLHCKSFFSWVFFLMFLSIHSPLQYFFFSYYIFL